MLRPRSASCAVLFAWSLLLAGCAAETASPSSTGRAPEAPQAEFRIGEGAIQGNVLDESLLPVPNATVRLLEIGAARVELASFLTGLDGTFAFSHVQPREYQMEASAEGFANRTLLVRVQPDELTRASIQLSEIPGDDPYSSLFMKNGMQICATRYVVGSLTAFVPLRTACAQFASQGNISSLVVDVPAGHRAAVVEFDWPHKPSSGEWSVYVQTDPKTGSQLVAAGEDNKSPHRPVVRVELRAGETYLKGGGVLGYKPVPYPAAETPFRMLAGVVYGGEHTDTIRQGLGPYCQTNYCMGAGFQLQWRFTDYVTLFVNEAPASLAAYSAIPDQ